MVRKTLILAAAFFLVTLFAGSSMAEENSMGMYVELGGLVNIHSLDEQQSMDKFDSPIIIDFDNSWGIQARTGIDYDKNISVEVMLEYISPFTALGDTNNSDEIDVVNFGVNGKISYPLYEGKLAPFLLVGASAMNVFEEIIYDGASSETSTWGGAVRAGGGLDLYPSGKQWSYRLEGAYVFGLGEVEHVRYTTISLGLAYHF